MRTLVLAAALALTQVNDGTIEVTVRDARTREGISAARVTVTLTPTQPTQPPSFVMSSFTDDKGVSAFKNLLYGVYSVRVEREGYGPAGNDTDSLFIRADAPTQRIQSDFIRVGDALRAGAAPKERLPLLLSSPAMRTGPVRTEDQKTGEFTLSRLGEGARYDVGVFGLPADAFVADVRQNGFSVYTTDGGIESNATAGPVEVVVGLQGGVVEGTVRNASGQGVAQAGVVLVPASPQRGNVQLYKELPADGSGQFSFRGVRPGEYKVFAWADMPRGQAYVDAKFLATYESRGVPVRVSAGSTSNAQVVATPLQ